MRRTICVLGGTGFIGTRLSLKLTEAGFNVNIVTRHKNRHMVLNNYPGVNLIEANLHTNNNLANVFKDCEVLINLIGVTNNSKGQSSYKKAHVDILRKVVSVIKHTNIKRIIQISALNADSSIASSGYLQTKGEAENILKVQTNAQTIVTVLRPSLVFGTSGGFAKLLSNLLDKFSFLPLPCPDATINPIYIDDLATAITQCIDNTDTFDKSYDLCGNKVYKLKEIVQIMHKAKNSNTRIILLSDFMSKILASFLNNLPGKIFTADKYAFLQYDANLSKKIDFMPNYPLKSFEMWAEKSLVNTNSRQKYFQYRQTAGR